MFSIKQIEEAHSRVSTGADFPRYIAEIRNLGVTSFKFNVSDGKEIYFGENSYEAVSEPKYDPIKIQSEVNFPTFTKELIDHQQGKTDFPHFIKICAENGVNNWIVDLEKMVCTYFDSHGNKILQEPLG
ncbi:MULTISPECIES: DUF1398 domain-containing protein [Sphingobacterium]|uniref:DUF1398 family protein n=1 Tax=Sphingobacterium tenebrionis TaxID=3111775 RepID=A0ABU8I4Q6_9SPHI|nr:DUF1398 family protein [Sphingobacterium sp. CZ-2]QBR11540.1 DUF1398 domain-containing protein [Sphingobacterium sp. CZ-2]